MKFTSSFFTIFLLASSLLLSGCFGGGEEESTKGESVSHVGTLKSLGEVVVEERADHILETKNGDVYYVYSDFLDLDKSKYENAYVQVSGTVTAVTDSGKEVVAIESIVALDEEVIEQDAQGEEEKKYRNLDSGFQIEHMIGWLLESEDSNYVEFTKDGASFVVARYDNSTSLTLEEWLELDQEPVDTPTLLGPDSLKSYRIESIDMTTYFVSRTNEFIYEITLTYPTPAFKNELLTIVNSFRFVPLKGTSDESAGESNPSVNITDGVIQLRSDEQIAQVKDYFAKNLGDLAPDYGGADYEILQFEFLNTPYEGLPADEPDYVYVVYTNGKVRTRMLVSYMTGTAISDVKAEALFEEGTVTDWELVDGEDLIKGQPVLIVKMGDDVSPVALEEGFRLFESGPFDFSIQYPSNWYVQGQGGKYLFNDAPLNGDYLVSVEVQKKKIEDVIADIPFSFESFDVREDREAFIAHPVGSDLGVYIVLSRNEGEEAYVLWTVKSQEELLATMAKSIVD